MDNRQNRSLKKKKFPLGIFLMLLIIESAIAVAAVGLYFRHTGKKQIEKIEKYTRNYSMSMIDAFSDVAKLSYRAGNYSVLKTLFRQEIREDTIDEAFFVKNDGSLIVHSSRKVEKELKGNIATDEFAYNIDLILRPARRKLSTIQFTSYNVMHKKVPFRRDVRELLEKYLYDEINMLGWLVSKAVYHKKRPVGTVNFIIYKERVYDFIQSHMKEAIKFYKIAQVIAFIVSLVVSIIVLIRYRSIQEKTYRDSLQSVKGDLDRGDIIEVIPEERIAVTMKDKSPGEETITVDILEDFDDSEYEVDLIEETPEDEGKGYGSSAAGMPEMIIENGSGSLPGQGQIIKDAIPIQRKS
jgi:hypothetical protein